MSKSWVLWHKEKCCCFMWYSSIDDQELCAVWLIVLPMCGAESSYLNWNGFSFYLDGMPVDTDTLLWPTWSWPVIATYPYSSIWGRINKRQWLTKGHFMSQPGPHRLEGPDFSRITEPSRTSVLVHFSMLESTVVLCLLRPALFRISIMW